MNLPLAKGQTQASQAMGSAAPDKPLQAQPLDVNGDWRVAWQGRLGTEQCMLHLQMKGTKLTGNISGLTRYFAAGGDS